MRVNLFKLEQLIQIKKHLGIAIKFSGILLICTQISCTPRQSDQNLVIASNGKIDSLDPAQANKLLAIQLISSLGDTLYRINSTGELEPRLAKELPKISSDGLTITIPLREDVYFHDGNKFDSKAMAFSINRFINIGTLNYIIDQRIKSVEAPSNFIIKLNLSRPSSSLNGLLTSINLTPISPATYTEYEDKFLNDTFIGTGPYKLIKYSPERQVLEPFDNYWDGRVKNKGINYISLNTSTSLFSALRTGEIDILLSNSLEDGHRLALHKLSEKNMINESKGPAMQIGYIVFKTKSGNLNNKNIRKALLYSIDRELISNKVSYGMRRPLRAIIPPILQKNEEYPWPRYNPKIASEMFKESGFCTTKKLILPLTFRSNVPADKLLALTWKEQVRRDLSNCLEITLNGVESTTVYKQLAEGVHEAVILGWTGDYPDPYAYLNPLLDCKKINNQICEEGEAVFGGTFWASKELQKSLKRSELLSGKKRFEELQKAQRIAAEGASILPVWIVSPRAWSKGTLTAPQFDGSGKLILNTIEKRND